MDSFAQRLKSYIETHPFDSGDSDCVTVLDQLYQGYADSHESDPQEIRDAFEQLGDFLEDLPLADNDMLFGLVCRLCIAYDRQSLRMASRVSMRRSTVFHSHNSLWESQMCYFSSFGSLGNCRFQCYV